jgi:hypothetical protein
MERSQSISLFPMTAVKEMFEMSYGQSAGFSDGAIQEIFRLETEVFHLAIREPFGAVVCLGRYEFGWLACDRKADTISICSPRETQLRRGSSVG